MTVKFTEMHLIANGKRVRVSYTTGPWVAGVDPTTIKVRPFPRSHFPASFREYVTIENNSDSREDYFERDCIRITSTHPLYAAVRAVAK